MAHVAWHKQSAGFHAASIKKRAVSSCALVEYYISRIEHLDDQVNAVVVRTFDAARARAKLADEATAKGRSWGPLHGVPITVKESFWWEGTLSTCAIPEIKDFVAQSNAPTIQRLLDAGAIILGKTNIPVWTADVQSYNDKYGVTNNPWDLSRTPGGSSGGSAAALAAGFSALELGSDIGGSIRNPAHFCGVCGHKPTQGIVQLQGHGVFGNHFLIERIPGFFNPEPTFHHQLATAGPLARTCSDLELAMRILSFPEPYQQANGWSFTLPPARVTEPSSLRVAAWLDDSFCAVDAECVALMTRAAVSLQNAGASVDFNARPKLDFASAYSSFADFLDAAYSLPGTERPEPIETLKDYQKVVADRWELKQRWISFFKKFDVLLCPVVPCTAFKHDHSDKKTRVLHINGIERDYLEALTAWPGIVIFADLPSTVVPVGRDSKGLPCGIQVVAPHWQDLQSIEVGKMLERLGCCFVPPPAFEASIPVSSKL